MEGGTATVLNSNINNLNSLQSPNSATHRHISHHDSSDSIGSENEYKIRGLDSRLDFDAPSHLHKKNK